MAVRGSAQMIVDREPGRPATAGTGQRLKWSWVVPIGLLALIVANLWERQSALLTISAQVAMAVPPIPALAVLLLLVALMPLLRRVRVSRREVIAIYCFLTLAVALTSGGAMRFLLPAIPTLYYFTGPENQWQQFHDYIPQWMCPTDESVIRAYFEGAESGSVPWAAWAGPLALWLLFFAAFFGLLICLALVFRPEWENREHLSYPLAELPLMLTGQRSHLPNIWRNGVFWTGFLLVCLFDLGNILHGFNPGVAASGTDTDLSGLFAEWPLSALAPLRVSYRPEILGFGYLMPTEITLSTVFFYFFYLKGLCLGAALVGMHHAQLPFENEQASGAYLALVILLGYRARHRIARVFGALRRGGQAWGLALATILCAAVVVGFWAAAGMSLRVLLPYFALVFIFGLGYARLRAETGYPRLWGRPLGGERNLLLDLFGTAPFSPGGDMRSLTLMASTYYLSRGYMAQLVAYPAEAFRVAGEAHIDVRRMALLLAIAVIAGTVVSWWMQLSAFYEYGANVLEGGTTSGGYRIDLMRQSYTDLAGWAMLLLVSAVKMAALRIGGMRAYHAFLPAFIGIAVGHYFAAGLVWSVVSSFGGETFTRAYQLWF
ncbi:MAG: DUF6785 family protein [Armatimonadota bacterium]